jgi:DDB1- and CUL4-associated factor 8
MSMYFTDKFYGSRHAVERLELMYKLDDHRGCVNALHFNESGSKLVSGSDDMRVVVWDWAIGKKYLDFDTGHRSNVFQVCWPRE